LVVLKVQLLNVVYAEDEDNTRVVDYESSGMKMIVKRLLYHDIDKEDNLDEGQREADIPVRAQQSQQKPNNQFLYDQETYKKLIDAELFHFLVKLAKVFSLLDKEYDINNESKEICRPKTETQKIWSFNLIHKLKPHFEPQRGRRQVAEHQQPIQTVFT